MRRGPWLALTLALTACAGHPLGEDWETLDAPARDARALEALRELFAQGIDGAGEPRPDREVLSCTLSGVRYRAEGVESALAWRDVDSIGQEEHPTLPARPVDLLVYLRRGSTSQATVKDDVEPLLSGTGLVSNYVVLRQRPRFSRRRFLTALEQVLAGRPPQAAPSPPPTSTGPATPEGPADQAPPPGDAAALEERLRTLKRWHDEGLIDAEEYARKKQALLDGY